MKSHIHFSIDRDLICAIMVGVLGGIVTLAMFFLSGYMITQSALGAPLYALMILVVSVKLFGFLRGLDIETEKVIQQVLEHHFSTTTVFIIAHRDSTIRSSARRIYIESGHLIKDDSIISVTRSEVKIDQ